MKKSNHGFPSGCPCCGAGGPVRFEKDVLGGKHRARYHECLRCRSLYVAEPHWLDEAYATSDPNANDAGRHGRAEAVATAVRELRLQGRIPSTGRWLDYGAGDSVLGDILTVQGYDVDRYDKYVPALAIEPSGPYDGCSFIEVLEHTTDPCDVLRRLGRLTDVVVLSTELYRGQGPDWLYLATDWGQHITFPSPEGLRRLAAAGGFVVEDARPPGGPLEMYLLRKEELPADAVGRRRVVLYNHFHAGDVAMSRSIIQEIVAHNPEVDFVLECQPHNAYLWRDLDLPIRPPRVGARDVPSVNLHFAYFPDALEYGLTFRNNVHSYNRQARILGLEPITLDDEPRFIELPRVDVEQVTRPSVLIENGPVLSGQRVGELNPLLFDLCASFPCATFYHSGPTTARADNLVDVSGRDLCYLSVLSERCDVLVCRLSAVMVCSFTRPNHGRRRIVWGEPLGCPIWDEVGVVYTRSAEELVEMIRQEVGHGHG